MNIAYIPFICLLLSTIVFGEWDDTELEGNSYEVEQKILETLLFSGQDVYNPKIPPGKRDVSPVQVRATMYILDISSVNDLKNEFSMVFYFRQKWNDPRLAFGNLPTDLEYIPVHDVESVWKPDSFFVQEREGKLHTLLLPNVLLRINRNGDILYSVRLSMTFGCYMDLRYFPLDTQKCSFMLESYGSDTNEIKYKWDNVSHSVGVSDHIDMPDFILTNYTFFSNDINLSKKSYSRLQMDFTFKRKVGLFMNKLYVPFVILVIASWFSFWIKAKFTSLRLTLILAILFIMFWLQSDVSRHTPPASYTKAVDVWTGVCLSLVFASLLQFILVSHMVKNEKHKKKQQRKVDPEALLISERNGDKLEKSSSLDNANVNAISQLIAENLSEGKPLYYKIDIFSRLFYPVIFGVFNLIYWPIYCSGN